MEPENKILKEELKIKEDKELEPGVLNIDFTKPIDNEIKGESLEFPVPCHACGKLSTTKMCTSSIPFFKEIIIMSFSCHMCGYQNTEVKTGGEIPPTGRKLVLKCSHEKELKRDCFKSETCHLIIPEVDFEMRGGSRGGAYTTIEGLLDGIITTFVEQNPFIGDNDDVGFKVQMRKFLKKMNDFKDGKAPFTIILDDPMSNSFIQSPSNPASDDELTVTDYKRTYEQDEELGLNDIKVDNYEET